MILGNMTTTALQGIHIEYAFAVELVLEMSNSPFFPFPLCISLYKEIGDRGMCIDRGQGRGQAKKGKKYVEMNLAHVQRPKGNALWKCPMKTEPAGLSV